MVIGTPEFLELFRKGIKGEFKVKDAGKLQWFTGMEVVRDREAGTIASAQRLSIGGLVRRLHLEGAKPVYALMVVGPELSRAQCPTTKEVCADMVGIPYTECVGAAMWIAVCTRPDAAFPVAHPAQYMSNPGRAYWEELKRLARYLITTRNLWVVYGRTKDGLTGYADADWGSSDDTRHSHAGYAFTFDGGAISWSLKEQNVVALSTTEAEYIGITHALKEVAWLRYMLADLFHPDFTNHSVRLYLDNKLAIDLARKNAYHGRTKHIAIRYHLHSRVRGARQGRSRVPSY